MNAKKMHVFFVVFFFCVKKLKFKGDWESWEWEWNLLEATAQNSTLEQETGTKNENFHQKISTFSHVQLAISNSIANSYFF